MNFFAFRMYDSERLQNIHCNKSIDYLNFSLQPGVNLKRVSKGKLVEALWREWRRTSVADMGCAEVGQI